MEEKRIFSRYLGLEFNVSTARINTGIRYGRNNIR